MDKVTLVRPGQFSRENHFYPRVLNAHIHPVVQHLFNLNRDRMLNRYCHLHPKADREALEQLLAYECKYLRWAGCDLINVTPASGGKRMVVIETNSCPSGQKSMPLRDENNEAGGYRHLLERVMNPADLKRAADGEIAVLYDKNEMEASGYAATLADLFEKPVHLVRFLDNDPDPSARFVDGVLQVRTAEGNWVSVSAALRYVTQRPWNRIPVMTKTFILNPVLACLAGGRNKLMATKAYDLFNAEWHYSGIRIQTPNTVCDVSKGEIPLVIQSLGGVGVVKIPYSNAGQGVFTIVNREELDAFMEKDYPYDQYIVQSLIGNYSWSSRGPGGQLFHVGTVPNKRNEIFVSDIRFMVCSGKDGFSPVAAYARKAARPLKPRIDSGEDSWEMLGTNLSKRREDGSWDSETQRLVLMDTKDFNSLGYGVDELIEAYIQTVLAVTAIDKMALNLVSSKGRFREKLFRSLNKDPQLVEEIRI